MPSQCSMANTVVAFRVAPLSPCSTGRADMVCTPSARGCTPGQMGRVLGAVGIMHLEADDLAAVEVEDQVEIEPASLDLRRQERHIPAPDLAGAGGDVCGRWARHPWWLGSPSAVHLAVRAQHAMEAG